jgi:hypothetical protein
MKTEFQLFNRREFVGFLSQSAALFGLGAAAAANRAAAGQGTTNPFAYDISKLQKTDPKLVTYEEFTRWHCSRPDTHRIAAGPGDRLLVCAGNYVTAFSADGRPGLEIALSGPACCVAVARDQTVFVGLRDHVEVFDANGQRLAAWESPDKKSWFTSLAVGDKDIFAADAGKRVVLRYDRAGNVLGRIGEKNAERDVPGFVVPSPYLDVLVHPDGLLRVSNPGRHRVEAYTFDGDFAGSWGDPSTAISGFCGCCNPIAIELLPDGRFVTSEKGIPRVKIYSATGAFESVVAGSETFPENARACTGLNDCAHGGLDAAVDSQGRVFILDLVTGDVRGMKRKN